MQLTEKLLGLGKVNVTENQKVMKLAIKLSS